MMMTQSLVQRPFRLNALINKCNQEIANTRILMVGVGGIGCEILKVLSKTPIGLVHIVDMDTIQLSNLNRQFLFKQQHKGMSKSLVAKQTILKLNPSFRIEAHHMNIKDFPIAFFKQFNFFILALDNIEARNYVNKIGIRLNIPIIDAGTLAYTGNVTTIIPHSTKCYACQPKSANQKAFPVCTIRIRPEKPIHCVVWAKMLFQAIFGADNDDNELKDLAELAKESNELQILEKLFQKDIEGIKNAKSDTDKMLNEIFVKKIKIIESETFKQNIGKTIIENYIDHESKQTLEISVSLFSEAFLRLSKLKQEQSLIVFEKDDDNIIHFIAAAANLRMHCFNIELQSFNEVKNMAGNIIPAIASTNSIVSGIEVIEMIKKIKNQTEKMRSYFIQNQQNKILTSKFQKPVSNCRICNISSLPVKIDCNLKKYKLSDLISLIQQKAQWLEDFSINHGSKQIYISDEPKEVLLAKTIFEIGQSYELDLILTNQDTSKIVCVVWLTHNEELEEPIITHQEKFKPTEVETQEPKEVKPVSEEEDDLVVAFDDENSPEIEIIEPMKRLKFTSEEGLEEGRTNLSEGDEIKKRKKLE